MFEQERLDIRLAIFGMVAPAALGFHTACRLHVNSTTVVKLYVMLLVVYETESNVAMILSPKKQIFILNTKKLLNYTINCFPIELVIIVCHKSFISGL